MYVILDKSLKRIGQLSLDKSPGSCPFWGDEVDIQIADEDQDETLDSIGAENYSEFNRNDPHSNTKNWNHVLASINVPYGYPETAMITEGNSLMYRDEGTGHYYVLRLTDVTDTSDASGNHVKSAIGVNLAIWDLGHTKVQIASLDNANVKQAFTHLLGGTGWTMGTVDMHGGNPQSKLEFDSNSNAQAMLQTLCQLYDIEVDAYVEFNAGNRIAEKRIDIVKQLGSDNGQTLEYGLNIKKITRTITDANLYTRIYPIGKNGETIEKVNDGKPYVEDKDANQQWVSVLPNEGAKFLEGTVQSSTIANPSAVRDWAINLLPKFNHPRANYTVDGQFNANLGDVIRVKDLLMQPAATVKSRVIQKKISQADPTTNQCVVGEFATVIAGVPSLVADLRAQMRNINDLVETVKKDASALKIELLTPDGTDFSLDDQQKRVIAQVFINSQNVTTYLTDDAFIWQHVNADGSLDEGFNNRYDDTQVGYLQVLDDSFEGTLRCSIDTDFIATIPEIYTEDVVDKLITIKSDGSPLAIAIGKDVYTLSDDDKVTDQVTGGVMSLTNIGNSSMALDGEQLLFENTNSQIVKVPFKSGTVDLNTATVVGNLSNQYQFTFDDNNRMFILTDGVAVYAVNDVDILNGIIPTYKVTDYKKLGFEPNIKQLAVNYPEVFLASGDNQLSCFNIINDSPVFTHTFGDKSGTLNSPIAAIYYRDGYLYTNVQNGPNIIQKLIIKHRDQMSSVDDPMLAFNPNDMEQKILDDTAGRMKKVQTATSVTIGFITDTHVDLGGSYGTISALRHIKAMSYFANHNNLDYVVHGGDVDDGNKPKSLTYADIKDSMDAMNKTTRPYFVLNGNHDDNSGYARDIMNKQNAGKINNEESYPIRLALFNKNATIDQQNKYNPYGSYTFQGKDVVAIFLNSFDGPEGAHDDGTMIYITHQRSSFLQEQITWLAGLLNSIPNNTHVIVFTHSSIKGVFQRPTDHESFANNQHAGNEVWGMLSAFQNATKYSGKGTGFSKYNPKTSTWTQQKESNHRFDSEISVDFTKKPKGRLVGIFSGHTHTDKALKKEGIWNFETCCSIFSRGSIEGRKLGQANEDCWDVITVDPVKRSIDFTRYGAGSDRHFNY